jgi:hypothetical protein
MQFREFYIGNLIKFSKVNPNWSNPDKNMNIYVKIYVQQWQYLTEFFLNEEEFQTEVEEDMEIYIWYQIYFFFFRNSYL